MSGTSADGVDAVAVEVDSGAFHRGWPLVGLRGHLALPYDEPLRQEVLAAAANHLEPASLCILQRRLGEHHAQAARSLCAATSFRPDLASLHGQTVQHHPGQGASLQLADPFVLVEALGCPVVWDLRRRDLALGGQGAPLVPLPERWLHGPEPWLALNLGGIANLAYWDGAQLQAWDTGPGMSLLDLASGLWLGVPFDPQGGHASGVVAEDLLHRWLEDAYFRLPPPKSTGREGFGERWLQVEQPRLERLTLGDRLATLAAFTAASVARELQRLDLERHPCQALVSGGGALHQRLRSELVLRTGVAWEEDRTFPSGAREAVSWALLGAACALGLPGNDPAVTGASRAAVLGSWVFP